jgi:hypothetical protein
LRRTNKARPFSKCPPGSPRDFYRLAAAGLRMRDLTIEVLTCDRSGDWDGALLTR